MTTIALLQHAQMGSEISGFAVQAIQKTTVFAWLGFPKKRSVLGRPKVLEPLGRQLTAPTKRGSRVAEMFMFDRITTIQDHDV